MSDTRLYLRLEHAFLGLAIALPACPERPAGYGGYCCSEGEWTTSADVAKVYASPGSTLNMGCPSKVTSDVGDAAVPPDAGAPPPGALDLFDEPTKKLQATGDTSCVYKTFACCPGGRPLYARNSQQPIVAARARGSSWSRTLPALGHSLAPEIRAQIARAWLDDALAEHASVASFSLATLELMAVGAPSWLLAATQRAAMDEIHHAELCFALARAYGGHEVDPGPIAIPSPRGGGLVGLACNTFVEGCVAETIGALLAKRALERCTVPEVRDALRVIAADEESHAALAWQTLSWALQSSDEVAAAVVRTVQASRSARTRTAEAPTMDLGDHGRLDPSEAARAANDVWQFVIDPLSLRIGALFDTKTA